jgi:hypothetical protein
LQEEPHLAGGFHMSILYELSDFVKSYPAEVGLKVLLNISMLVVSYGI